jgi:hypothetical protein
MDQLVTPVLNLWMGFVELWTSQGDKYRLAFEE